MKLNELSPSVPKKNRKRIGRGNSSGWGKTAGKGSNGQNSRAGGGVKPYFEGGQMPIYRRVPKRGFSNTIFKKEYTVVSLSFLNDNFEDGEEVSLETLFNKCLIKKGRDGVTILGNGELNKKYLNQQKLLLKQKVEQLNLLKLKVLKEQKVINNINLR